MRVTTKVWLIISAITLAIVLVDTVISIQRQVDQRVEEARRSNGLLYEVGQLFAEEFVPPFIESGALPINPEEMQSLVQAGFVNASLAEVYEPDGSRLFTTNPDLTPSPPNIEGFQQALQGSTVSFTWVSGSGPEGGHRIGELSLLRLLRGGEFADEFWGPVQSPQGDIVGIMRLHVALSNLHDDVVTIVLQSTLLSASLLLVLWVSLWLSLQLLIRRPLAALTSTARRIHGGEITVRAPVRSKDELGDLATSFNAMADELERQATTDPITELLNHRYGNIALDEALQRARSLSSPLSVVIGDIDGFKLFNDTYGHPLGDEVLRLVAGVLREMSGDSGTPSRYGGDEFLIILPSADKAAASAFADRLAAAIGEIEFETGDHSRVPISLSLGVASFPEDTESKEHLLALADAAMYEAKQLGGTGREAPRVVAVGGDQFSGTFGALESLIQAVQYRDRYTKTHSDLVAQYAVKLGLQAGLSEEAARALRIAGTLHDVGKIIVPDEILKKPGRLTEEEYDIIKRHPSVGEMLIQESPFLEDVIQAVGCHHENYDGGGYPRGLCGDEIPLLGRIMAVADAYSAMSVDRPYRKALSLDEIIAELKAGAGTQFDPRLVGVFIDILQAEGKAKAA